MHFVDEFLSNNITILSRIFLMWCRLMNKSQINLIPYTYCSFNRKHTEWIPFEVRFRIDLPDLFFVRLKASTNTRYLSHYVHCTLQSKMEPTSEFNSFKQFKTDQLLTEFKIQIVQNVLCCSIVASKHIVLNFVQILSHRHVKFIQIAINKNGTKLISKQRYPVETVTYASLLSIPLCMCLWMNTKYRCFQYTLSIQLIRFSMRVVLLLIILLADLVMFQNDNIKSQWIQTDKDNRDTMHSNLFDYNLVGLQLASLELRKLYSSIIGSMDVIAIVYKVQNHMLMPAIHIYLNRLRNFWVRCLFREM